MGRIYDVLAIWKERGVNVNGKGLPGGHNLQEDIPAEVLAELRPFLRADRPSAVSQRAVEADLTCYERSTMLRS